MGRGQIDENQTILVIFFIFFYFFIFYFYFLQMNWEAMAPIGHPLALSLEEHPVGL
jgi:hypothetical protein